MDQLKLEVQQYINEQNEQKFDSIIEKCLASVPICEDRRTVNLWPQEINLDELLHCELSALPTSIQITRNDLTGEITGYNEVVLDSADENTSNSMKMTRHPGNSNSVLGEFENLPFFPGWLDDNFADIVENLPSVGEAIDFESDLLTCPPGFDKGFNFDSNSKQSTNTANYISLDSRFSNLLDTFSAASTSEVLQSKESDSERGVAEVQQTEKELDSILQKRLPSNSVVITLGSSNASDLINSKFEWAVWIDESKPFTDFADKIPLMCKEFPFELDNFQKYAIERLEKAECVFVAAHTSAGKTVVAEYAIALARKHFTRVVYTSPIKALSNQKFRDFRLHFDDVGLITGDIQLKPEASCLIMTTEILLLMLYNGSEIIRELEYVIFDEVHYINDLERGHVWEEVLIMLPKHINIIMLSATVPNTMEFADWVGRIKQRKIYVISTQKRPVPLEHFLYIGHDISTKNDRFLVVNKSGQFQNKGYHDAQEAVKKSEDQIKEKLIKKAKKDGRSAPLSHVLQLAASKSKSDRHILQTLIAHLAEQHLLPCVIFTFSRKRCDENAAALSSIGLNDRDEQLKVHQFFTSRCLLRLNRSDRQLPQVLTMQKMCSTGFAVHHSGILPILKEAVEMLFQEGLIKVLFATETFAMGVNMPARSVVFDSIQKHDGQSLRLLQPGEYTQMAGRAGRRGLDPTGTVIILCRKELPLMSDLSKMMLGKPVQLESKFRVKYCLILQVLQLQQLSIKDLLQRSFAENGSYRALHQRQQQLDALQRKMDQQSCSDDGRVTLCAQCYDGGIEQFWHCCRQLADVKCKQQQMLTCDMSPVHKLLTVGRVVFANVEQLRVCPAVLLRSVGRSERKVFDALVLKSNALRSVDKSELLEPEEIRLLFDIAMNLHNHTAGHRTTGDGLQHLVHSIHPTSIISVTPLQLSVAVGDILKDWQQRQQPKFRHDSPDRSIIVPLKKLQSVTVDMSMPFIDDAAICQVGATEYLSLQTEWAQLIAKGKSFECLKCANFAEHIVDVNKVMHLKDELVKLKTQFSVEALKHEPDYCQKLQVLKALKFVNENDTVPLKGKVAVMLPHQELLITEMLLENMLSRLQPAEIAAALSVTCFQQKNHPQPEQLPGNLQQIREEIEAICSRIDYVQHRFEVTQESDDVVHFGMMQTVYEWARGVPFCQLMQQTTPRVQEGIIVRCIQRLDELVKAVRSAAALVGNMELRQKMDDTSVKLRRDIVFAASLYTL